MDGRTAPCKLCGDGRQARAAAGAVILAAENTESTDGSSLAAAAQLHLLVRVFRVFRGSIQMALPRR
jgi:hypothetical protein